MVLDHYEREKEKIMEYPDISRGTSLTIPVYLFDENKKPLKTNDLELYFTLKKVKADFDYDDERALIQKSYFCTQL